MKRRGISPAELEREYRRCIRRERDRYRAWSKTRQGAFETYNVLHFDAQAEEDFERDFASSWLSDGGKGAAAIRRGNVDDEARSKRAMKAALARARRISPELARTLRLIMANGKNRDRSIECLARKMAKGRHSAEVRYYRHRKALLALFNA